MLSDHYLRIPLDEILVERDTRYRRDLPTEDLKSSIAKHGVLSPIIVKASAAGYTLVAGERRLTASRELGLPDIPCRLLHELEGVELRLLELEENLKRRDLSWQDTAKAIRSIHDLLAGQAEGPWSYEKTAREIGLHLDTVRANLRVAKALLGPEAPKLAGASGLIPAFHLLQRLDERKSAGVVSDILHGVAGFLGVGSEPITPESRGIQPNPPDVSRASTAPPAPPLPILTTDFLTWAPTYSGPPFNLLHCDFPWGRDEFEGRLSLWRLGTDTPRAELKPYESTPEAYWALVEALCVNRDRLMAHSAHLLFWFSMHLYRETLERFAQLAPDLEFNRVPLVWLKSDNRGVAPDPSRGPRHVYETALLASRGDRRIVRVCANAYSAPTDKLYHHSSKPEPMLRHFFGMLVDEHTSLLDPTCGGGSALRAAESLGAERILGLEISPEYAEGARAALKHARALRRIEI